MSSGLRLFSLNGLAMRVPDPKGAAKRRSKGSRPLRGMGRGEILAVAMELFAQHGYDGVSTADIAAAAGLSQSVVLYHFSSKENLWRDAMRGLFAKVNTQSLIDQDAYKELDVTARLRVAIRQFAHRSAQAPEFARVVTREGMAGGPRLRWLIEDLSPPMLDIFHRLIEEGTASGAFKPCSPGHMTMVIHTVTNIIFLLAPLTEIVTGQSPFSPEVIEHHTDTVVDLVLNGLAVRPATGPEKASKAGRPSPKKSLR